MVNVVDAQKISPDLFNSFSVQIYERPKELLVFFGAFVQANLCDNILRFFTNNFVYSLNSQINVLGQSRHTWLILGLDSSVHEAKSDCKVCVVVTENVVDVDCVLKFSHLVTSVVVVLDFQNFEGTERGDHRKD